ncbi:MAG: dipicolinate synthase subunit DpsA [Bacillota bacterium]|nr:dipicolinate synthase subunit DpsA [Bacillota bacterium]
MKINSFSIIGGDKRQLAAANAILLDGCAAFISGFDRIKLEEAENISVAEAAIYSEVIILPLPVSKDSETLNAPFSSEKIKLDDDFARLMQGKKVFCGMKDRLLKTSKLWNSNNVYDYFEREEFAVFNAVPTAEGAIEIAMKEYPGTIQGSRCLITGYGRIAKILASMLKGIGANVTVAARKKGDLAYASSFGYQAVDINKMMECGHFDIVFNTVPALIFDARMLAHLCEEAIVIDLASAPGGVDIDSAKRLDIQVIQALSLPGKAAPKRAGEIIKDTIYNMLEEDNE